LHQSTNTELREGLLLKYSPALCTPSHFAAAEGECKVSEVARVCVRVCVCVQCFAGSESNPVGSKARDVNGTKEASDNRSPAAAIPNPLPIVWCPLDFQVSQASVRAFATQWSDPALELTAVQS